TIGSSLGSTGSCYSSPSTLCARKIPVRGDACQSAPGFPRAPARNHRPSNPVASPTIPQVFGESHLRIVKREQDEELVRHAIKQALRPRPTPGHIRDLANFLLTLADELEQRATADEVLAP
ncbi:MAG TPA: hypothetical protein VLA19_26275, partial [Herpetosiphonaceae bacterium]|nr:hypothetical protein [Herpetosiphonaceae bacterium]